MFWLLIAALLMAEAFVKLRVLSSLPLEVLTCADRGGRFVGYAPLPGQRQ